MPAKYVLKRTRPRNRSKLAGLTQLMGKILVTESGVFLTDNVEKGELLGYFSPAAMYSSNSGKVPRSVVDQSIVLLRTDTRECLYTKIYTESHWSIFLDFHTLAGNIGLLPDSKLVALQDIHASRSTPAKMVCRYGLWKRIFTQTPYPTTLATINLTTLQKKLGDFRPRQQQGEKHQQQQDKEIEKLLITSHYPTTTVEEQNDDDEEEEEEGEDQARKEEEEGLPHMEITSSCLDLYMEGECVCECQCGALENLSRMWLEGI